MLLPWVVMHCKNLDAIPRILKRSLDVNATANTYTFPYHHTAI